MLRRSILLCCAPVHPRDAHPAISQRTRPAPARLSHQGHVVYLKDAEVFWENVGGSLSLPLLPLETFDVDMGEGARIESIRIVNGQVALKCRVVISPFPPLLVASLRKRAAFRYDVAERLSVTFGNLVQNMKILNLQFRPNQA